MRSSLRKILACSTLLMLAACTSQTGMNEYVNKQYGYSIQYPKNWHVDTQYAEKDFTPRGPDNELMGGDLYVSNYAQPTSYALDTIPADLKLLSLIVFKADPAEPFERFTTDHHFDFDQALPVTIDGITSIKLLTAPPDSEHPAAGVAVLIPSGNNIFWFNYKFNPNDPSDTADVYESIIQSFKLAK